MPLAGNIWYMCFQTLVRLVLNSFRCICSVAAESRFRYTYRCRYAVGVAIILFWELLRFRLSQIETINACLWLKMRYCRWRRWESGRRLRNVEFGEIERRKLALSKYWTQKIHCLHPDIFVLADKRNENNKHENGQFNRRITKRKSICNYHRCPTINLDFRFKFNGESHFLFATGYPCRNFTVSFYICCTYMWHFAHISIFYLVEPLTSDLSCSFERS